MESDRRRPRNFIKSKEQKQSGRCILSKEKLKRTELLTQVDGFQTRFRNKQNTEKQKESARRNPRL